MSLVDLGEKKWLVSGLVLVEELEKKLDASLSGDDYETVAGLIFTSLGRVPATGSIVKKNGFCFEVERADRRRIYRVKVSPDLNYDADAEQEES
ncbi:MAG TPA: transporter associated domain-containing protein [Candidatus Paceibacterota bacterium]|nr:transporter associated domain-containing protein [Candidatus Paceibacterota bacterium]